MGSVGDAYRAGLVEAAVGGTLFLDERGALPPTGAADASDLPGDREFSRMGIEFGPQGRHPRHHHYWSGVLEEFKGTVSDVWGVVEESGWLKLKGVDILDRSTTDSMYVEVWDDMPDDLVPAGCAITGGGPGG